MDTREAGEPSPRTHLKAAAALLAAGVALALLARANAGNWAEFPLLLTALATLIGLVFTLGHPRAAPLKSAALLAISLVLTLLLLELCLLVYAGPSWRLASYDVVYSSADDPDRAFFAPTETGVRGAEGVYRVRREARDGGVIFDVSYTIGPDGRRVTPAAAERGAFPIDTLNFFGGSYTFGWGLEDDETLPALVARQLGVPVRNHAFNGHGAHENHALMASEGIGASGEINLFVTAPFHAARSACHEAFATGSPRYRLVGEGEKRRLVRDGVCPHPVFGPYQDTLLAKAFYGSRLYSLLERSVKALHDKDAEYELYLALIEDMDRLSRQGGARFAVVYIENGDFARSSHTHETLKSRLRGLDIEVIELTPLDPDDAAYRIHPEESHPSVLAIRMWARQLADSLRDFVGSS